MQNFKELVEKVENNPETIFHISFENLNSNEAYKLILTAKRKLNKMTDIEWEEFLIPFIDSYFDGHLPQEMNYGDVKKLYLHIFEQATDKQFESAMTKSEKVSQENQK